MCWINVCTFFSLQNLIFKNWICFHQSRTIRNWLFQKLDSVHEHRFSLGEQALNMCCLKPWFQFGIFIFVSQLDGQMFSQNLIASYEHSVLFVDQTLNICIVCKNRVSFQIGFTIAVFRWNCSKSYASYHHKLAFGSSCEQLFV